LEIDEIYIPYGWDSEAKIQIMLEANGLKAEPLADEEVTEKVLLVNRTSPRPSADHDFVAKYTNHDNTAS